MTTERTVFTKELTKTDVGKRGPDGRKSNQSGVGVSKKSLTAFPYLDPNLLNPEALITAVDDDGTELDLRYIYFNGRLHGVNTRNEYRLTGLGPYLRLRNAGEGDEFTMTPLLGGSYHLSLRGSSTTSRETVSRSREMWVVALFLSRFGADSNSLNPAPPGRLNVTQWRDAYDLFYKAVGDERTKEQFRRSLKNARDIFDAHVAESGRTGWRQEDDARTPQRMGELASEVWNAWGFRSEAALWGEVQRILRGQTTLPRGIGKEDSDDDAGEARDDDPYARTMQSIRQRRGQAKFRSNLLRAYGNKCAISGHGPDDVLEAAHIEPHSIAGHNSTDNGLLLRADLHTLMDAGLLVIDPDSFTVMIHISLIGSPYEALIGKPVRKPVGDTGTRKGYLRDRFDAVVRGSRSRFLPLA